MNNILGGKLGVYRVDGEEKTLLVSKTLDRLSRINTFDIGDYAELFGQASNQYESQIVDLYFEIHKDKELILSHTTKDLVVHPFMGIIYIDFTGLSSLPT